MRRSVRGSNQGDPSPPHHKTKAGRRFMRPAFSVSCKNESTPLRQRQPIIPRLAADDTVRPFRGRAPERMRVGKHRGRRNYRMPRQVQRCVIPFECVPEIQICADRLEPRDRRAQNTREPCFRCPCGNTPDTGCRPSTASHRPRSGTISPPSGFVSAPDIAAQTGIRRTIRRKSQRPQCRSISYGVTSFHASLMSKS